MRRIKGWEVKWGECVWLEIGGIDLECFLEGDVNWMGNFFIV